MPPLGDNTKIDDTIVIKIMIILKLDMIMIILLTHYY